MEKTYMVVELPKDDSTGQVWLNAPVIKSDFFEAFDLVNERMAAEGQQLFRHPRMPQPIRVALSDRNIEIWVVNRSESLFKA
jgi:hypothetical protein